MGIPLVYHTSYSKLVLPSAHRFPTTKYQLLQQYLISSGIANTKDFHSPTKICIDQLKQVHDPDYVDGFLANTLDTKQMRRIGFPWSESLVDRTLHAVNGTVLCAKLAIENGVALHLSGGYHHAHQDFGSGFCIFNDLILAASTMINSGKASKVLIIDCDVHQGDGTATLASNNTNIVTCSFHCLKNFPARKAKSDHDVEFHKYTSDDQFIETITEVVPYLINIHQPDLILYDAGVDIHINDDLGYLNISTAGILARDTIILSTAKKAQIPIAAVIGGGYSRDETELTQRHSQLFIAANSI
ncbi:histone deacetylase [Shewanella sp. UCD-FRSSP16_17]|uniref:histone deacetylase family protein n=1 Tax=unclassified Shewanella TaxID=196818 RepID=UPI0006D67BDF|nr:MULTISPECIES: histone deacetylase [unclassified Shewanella]OBT11928.1 histone deacetylase [Shewanella sp. UCD-FRSSP16_17]